MPKNIIHWFKKIHTRLRGPRRYRQLFDTIAEIKPLTLVEVGTWNGNRAVEMINCALKYQATDQLSYNGFDLFDEMSLEKYKEEVSKWPPSLIEVNQKLKKTGVSVNLHQGDTIKTLPQFVLEWGKKADFVFIDGGHHLDTVTSDWVNTKKILKKGSVVIFDDYWPERPDDGGSKHTVDAIDENEFQVEILPITDVFDHKEFGQLVIKFAKVTKL